jgi:hypothetical protein
MKSKLICLSVIILALLLSGCLGSPFGGTADLEEEISSVMTQFGNDFKDQDFSGLASLFKYPASLVDFEGVWEAEDETEMADIWDYFIPFDTIYRVDTTIFKPTKQGNALKTVVLFAICVDYDVDTYIINLSWEFMFQKDGTSWKITQAKLLGVLG